MKPVINFHGGDEDSGNVFTVETFAPAGMVLESHKHEHSHSSVLAFGTADVTIDGKTERHTGPAYLTIPKNTQHEVKAVTDIAWYCLWADSLAPRYQIESCLKLSGGVKYPVIIGDGVIPEAESVRDVQRALGGRGDVVLLAHVASATGQEIPTNATIYNLEPLFDGCRSLQTGYLDVLRRHKVWDYQARNVEFLRSRGIDALHVPYRYSAALERAPKMDRDIEVLFVGSMSHRRRRILDEIDKACGLVVAQGCYGSELDQLIARAKLIVNIHYCDEPHPLEVVRLNYMMANGCAVISEPGWDKDENAQYAAGLIFSNDVAAECKRWIGEDLTPIRTAARQVIRSMPMEVPA